MSKLVIYRKQFSDYFFVTPATITTGWIPGEGMQLDSTGVFAQLGVVDNVMGIFQDSSTETLSSPPTGSLCSVVYGSGVKFVIDHTQEVAAASAN